MKKHTQLKNTQGGFTLIEILVVIGIIAVLATVVLIAINPARQFAQARDSQRTANTNAILNAIGQNLADNAGVWNCDTDLPDSGDAAEVIGDGTGEIDIRECIVPNYMPELPTDPIVDEADICIDADDDGDCDTDYTTGYTVAVLDAGSRVRVCTEDITASEEPALDRTMPICVTR